MKPQPPPALTVKPSEQVSARGERSPPSCRSRFITLAPASPRRRGLRSRGAGSPMTNVPVCRPQAPPGPATPSVQQVPGECLRVSVSGKELLKAQSLQKRYRDSSSCARSPGGGHRRGVLTRRWKGHPENIWDRNLSQGSQIPTCHLSLHPSAPPAQRTCLGAGEGVWEETREQAAWSCRVSICPQVRQRGRAARRACEAMVRVWGREDGLQGSKVAQPQGPASPAQPVPGVDLRKTGGRARGDRGRGSGHPRPE